MLGLFKRRAEDVSAANLYSACLSQSRLPEFYRSIGVADSYDGRVDLLTLHLTFIMKAARKFGAAGEQLSQALYDVMVEDFNIAMREEGLSDTGIKRRIKPMLALFYARAKVYMAALESGDDLQALMSQTLLADAGSSKGAAVMADYMGRADLLIDAMNEKQLRAGKIKFPPLSKA
ncbi:MAG: ubiquinol-cytochrome C chaperone family protein [Robiginitomaculum sp.]